MASITIRNLDDVLKQRLRERAARDGVSMEEEVRRILSETLAQTPRPRRNLYAAVRACLPDTGGVELERPPRQPLRQPPDFER